MILRCRIYSGTMPMSCWLIKCTRRFGKGSGITFLKIPDREPKWSAWINSIRRKNWVPSEHERVCSVHFLSGKFQFGLMLSVEKSHKTNLVLGYRYSIIIFWVFYYFLFRHPDIAVKSRAYKFSGLHNFRVHLLSNLSLQGQRTDDPNDPDYVPSLLMGYMEEGCFERCQ